MRNMWVLYTYLSACAIGSCLFIRRGVLKKVYATKTGLGDKLEERP